MTIRDIGREIDGMKRRFPDDGGKTENAVREIQPISERFARAATVVLRSPELTKDGRSAKLEPIILKAFEELEAERKRSVRLEAQISRLKAKARAETFEQERTEADRQDEAFARDALTKLSPLECERKYIEACEEGTVTILNAVARAARAGFPLVDEKTIARGEEVLIARSELAGEIVQATERHQFHDYFVGAVERELQSFAKQHGVALDDAERKVG